MDNIKIQEAIKALQELGKNSNAENNNQEQSSIDLIDWLIDWLINHQYDLRQSSDAREKGKRKVVALISSYIRDRKGNGDDSITYDIATEDLILIIIIILLL